MKFAPLILLVFICFASSCSITLKDIIGTWLVPKSDTLTFWENNEFRLIRTEPQLSKLQPGNISLLNHTVYGKWFLEKKNVILHFNDSSVYLTGGCTSLQYWRRNGKHTLVHPLYCDRPSHHFVSVKKLLPVEK